MSPYGAHGAAGGSRAAREVLEDHLRCRSRHAVEADIARNYAADVVLLTGQGVFRGHDGVRRSAALLHARLPWAAYEYRTVLLEGEVAFLEWAARSAAAVVEDGADSFVIRGGRIIIQTIHYTVIPRRTD
jgi:hypothetical protein